MRSGKRKPMRAQDDRLVDSLSQGLMGSDLSKGSLRGRLQWQANLFYTTDERRNLGQETQCQYSLDLRKDKDGDVDTGIWAWGKAMGTGATVMETTLKAHKGNRGRSSEEWRVRITPL